MVRDLRSIMAHIPPLFDKNQQLDEYKLVDSLDKKAPRRHKSMLIFEGFNPETGDLETFVEQCEQADTTDIIAVAKFSASDKDSDTMRKKKISMFTELE